ncbi:DUF456 domain-containing protein [Chryseolinea sp. T2]|uniref:DUF456 domain-containing protein n=1 Tax=Chryseolinea sp. T2 TaxID=3129255 RepID=UPI003077E4D5
MVTLWIVVGLLLMIAGIIGCVLPFLPGPPLCFLGLLVQQFNQDPPFSRKFMWIWVGVTAAVVALEYLIPVMGTKRFGGTKYGVWGCTIGLIAGFWFGPLGIIIGPFVGAFVGEILANQDSQMALRSAWGSFVGFLVGTLLKLIVCFVMAWYLLKYTYSVVVG